MSIAIRGMLASRNLAAMMGAMDSSVWKLDHQIDFFANQKLRVALRGGGVIPIIDGNNLDSFRRRRIAQPLGNVFGEMIVRALRSVAKSIALLLHRTDAGLILVFAGFFTIAALFQRIKKKPGKPSLVQAGTAGRYRANGASHRKIETRSGPGRRGMRLLTRQGSCEY